ncbi:MAG: hypothetical protein Kow00104_13670 [Rhodothalassiaceae bacterium]
MSDFRLALPVRQAVAAAIAARVDAGGGPAHIAIYSGPIPAGPAATPTGAVLLAELVMAMPAFGAPDANALISANPILADSTADATGTASFFRILDGAGIVLFQGDVSLAGNGGDLELPTLSIAAGITVAIDSLTLSVPEL